MAHASFGPAWPARNPNIVTLVRADGLRIPVHRELKDLTAILMDLTEMMGYDILPGQTWGYANRPISGTNQPSNHSQGTADDKNAPSNPYASADWHRRNARGTKPFGLQIVCNIPEKVIRLWEAHGYRWGGRYRTKPDPMHFEFMGTVTEARSITRNLKLFLAPKPVAPKPPPTNQFGTWPTANKPEIRLGTRSAVVGYLQSVINRKAGGGVVVDNNFGARTEVRVKEVQRFFNVPADGIVGPKTWAVIDYLAKR